MREVVNGLMYILSTGCQWRAIPKDLPPRSSVYDYFDLWTYDGTLESESTTRSMNNVANESSGTPLLSASLCELNNFIVTKRHSSDLVSPPLHHLPTIWHPLRCIVGAPNFVSFDMRELAFDPVTIE
jgi:hypothetical protein